MYIKQISEENVLVEEVYKMKEEEWKKIGTKKENVSLVEQFGSNKQKFIKDEGSPNTMVITVFTEFLKYELEYKKDMVEFSYKDFLYILREMVDEGIFTSESYYLGFVNLIYHYTEWGYAKFLREDIISFEEITREIPESKAVSKKIRYEKILTRNEMIMYAQKCPNEYAEIGLLLLMEGLKVNELPEIKIDEFNSEINHPIQLESRVVNITDNLYDKIKFCKEEVTGFDRNYKGIIKRVLYADTGYLFRPQDMQRENQIEKLTNCNVTVVMNKSLKEAGYNGTAINFRISSILNDYIDGADLNMINHKYGLNHKSIHEIHGIRYKSNIDILNEKRRMEGSLNMGN